MQINLTSRTNTCVLVLLGKIVFCVQGYTIFAAGLFCSLCTDSSEGCGRGGGCEQLTRKLCLFLAVSVKYTIRKWVFISLAIENSIRW